MDEYLLGGPPVILYQEKMMEEFLKAEFCAQKINKVLTSPENNNMKKYMKTYFFMITYLHFFL